MKINLFFRYYSGGETPPLQEDAAQTGKFVGQAAHAYYFVNFYNSEKTVGWIQFH